MKKKILVVWPKHREDWVLPFKELAQEFDFIFLSQITLISPRDDYTKNFAGSCYWSAFQSAQELLNDIKPYKIIFMSIESGLNITLNIVAKQRNITTCILQHGIYTNYEDYRIREKFWKKKNLSFQNESAKSLVGFSSLKWISNSLNGFNKIYLLPISLLVKSIQIIGPYWAAKHFSFEGKRPNTYICISPYNATIHKQVDKIDDSRIKYIGSPELLKYLKKEECVINEKFYLHIDQAFAENSFGEETVSKQKMIAFYQKLNEFCLSENAELYIKLHPESYNSIWLPKHKNIVYLKKVDNLNKYIQSAKGCFGFYSTMVIPAIYWKPTILFNIFYSGLQEALKDCDNVKTLPFESFQVENIDFPCNKINKDLLIKRFFYSKEQDSIKLLKVVLNA